MQQTEYKADITLTGTNGERVPFSVGFHAESDKQAAVKAMALADGAARSGSWPPSVQGYLSRHGGEKVGSFNNHGTSSNTKCGFTWAGLSASGVALVARNLAQRNSIHPSDPVDLLAYALLSVLKNGCDACEPTAAGVAALLEENLVEMNTF